MQSERFRFRHHRLTAGVIAAAALLCASPSYGQERDPASRQQLLDLAYVLGEAHALRQACRPDDQYWRNRMRRLIQVEFPDEPFADRLADRFNTGFTVREAQFTTCDARTRAEEQAVAARGRRMSDALSRIP